MDMKFKKKAVLFSLMSILFSILFVTVFSQNSASTYEDRLPGSNIRIEALDVYTRNLETYIGSSIDTSTYKALNAITIYRSSHGGFFANQDSFNKTFYNCIIYGNVDGTTPINNTNNCSLDQYTLTSRLESIKTLSVEEMNIKMTYNINNIIISQWAGNPFMVNVTIDISYNVTDNSSPKYYATWNKEKIISQPIVITGLLDPTGYISDAKHDGNRTIKEYSGDCVTNDACWNFVTVEQFYNESSFRQYNNGTSFLHRYWNDNSPSGLYGLETILHPSNISNIDVNSTYIDHYYWNHTYTCANHNKRMLNIILGSENVHMDDITAARYNVTGPDTC